MNFEWLSLNVNKFFSCKWDYFEIINFDKCDLIIFLLVLVGWLLIDWLWILKCYLLILVFWNVFWFGLKVFFRYWCVEGFVIGLKFVCLGSKKCLKFG